MKHYILLFFIIFQFCFSQPPADYYDTATGTGYTLKTQLYNIVSTNFQEQPYSAMWAFFEQADVLPNGKVWDIYANCNFDFGTPANGGNQDIGLGGNIECEYFNREHTVPTSWFGNSNPMRNDVVHIFPVDKKVNNERGNLPYGEVNQILYTSTNGSKRGTTSIIGPSGQVFEVVDDYKGDIARIFFYMATRYENIISGWSSLSTDAAQMLDGSSNKVFTQWALDMLFQWHIQDPVSTKETQRNNQIYTYQNNRNPFVDNPHWVEAIWGNVLNLSQEEPFNDLLAYPNPTQNQNINIATSQKIDIINVYNQIGQLVQVINKPQPITDNIYQIQNLPVGIYLLQLQSQHHQTSLKIISH